MFAWPLALSFSFFQKNSPLAPAVGSDGKASITFMRACTRFFFLGEPGWASLRWLSAVPITVKYDDERITLHRGSEL